MTGHAYKPPRTQRTVPADAERGRTVPANADRGRTVPANADRAKRAERGRF